MDIALTIRPTSFLGLHCARAQKDFPGRRDRESPWSFAARVSGCATRINQRLPDIIRRRNQTEAWISLGLGL